ncbi:MAG: methyltransferase domain-containing protein [Deltaproteobacteria bacterium]|nr:methyltransferase domain-containing protein [Deltaproteobacteria bacterium]
MGYVFDFHNARFYDNWFQNPANRFALSLETDLMIDMLKPEKGRTLLDIGCGTGESLLKYLEMGLQVTGIDPSPYMLDIAAGKIKNRADLHRGFAERLPFDDNFFHYASLMTTLEFVEEPKKALEEAFRVTKDRVFIGVLNRYALKGFQRRVKGIFTSTIFNHAQFFSIWELKKIIKTILGDVPLSWGTVCQFPFASYRFVSMLERNSIIQKCPFGAFIGMVVVPVPRYKTTALSIKCRVNHSIGAVEG